MGELNKNILVIVVTTLGIYLAGLFSITLGMGTEGVSMIWLPSGVGLLAVFLKKTPALIGVLIGVTLIELVGYISPNYTHLNFYKESLPLAIVLGIFGALEVIFNRYWILRLLPRFNFNSIKHIAIYIGITSSGCLLAAILSVPALTLANIVSPEAIAPTIIIFWLGNWCGSLLITPMGLAFTHIENEKHKTFGYGFPIIAIGLSLTLMASFMSYKIDNKSRVQAFDRQAQDVFTQINQSIELSIRDVNALHALYYRVEISRNEFNNFSNSILERNPVITKISWIPRIKHSQKDAFERNINEKEQNNFKIFDINQDLKHILVQTHDEYYPILYGASLKQVPFNYGFNVGSNPDRLEALMRAMSNGIPISTKPIKLIAGDFSDNAFNIYFPIYAGNVEETPALKTQGNIKGFVASAYSARSLLDSNLSQRYDQMTVYIVDTTDPKQPIPLVSSISEQDWRAALGKKHQFEVTRTLGVAGRYWKLTAIPKNENAFILPTSISFAVFIIGMLFTAMIAGFMLAKRKNEEVLLVNEQRLSVQNSSLSELTSLYAAGHQTLDIKTITEIAARTLHASQASVWFFNTDYSELVLQDLFTIETQSHSQAGVISHSDFPIYFANILSKKIIDAGDAKNDQRTNDLNEKYLSVHNVGALLDTPIIAGKRLLGVLSIEQKGRVRAWTTDEKTYAESLRNIIALSLESSARLEAQQALEQANAELEAKVESRTLALAEANQNLQTEVLDHQRAEDQLKIFRLFADAAPQGLGIAKFDRSTIYFNPTLQKLLQRSETPKTSVEDFMVYFSEESRNILSTDAMPTIQTDSEWSGELDLTLKNGDLYPVFVNLFSLKNEQHVPTYVAGIFYDLTAQKEVERQLLDAKNSAQAADLAKSMFIASMSHELRTPLNSIIGFTGVILQGLSGSLNERQTDQLMRVMRSAKHLLSLITDVIDISKIEAGYTNVHIEAFDLNTVLDESIHSVQNLRNEKQIDLVLNIDPNIVLTSDKKRTYQVILNLLSNAVKYSEEGTITVNAHQEMDKISIAISDTGIGISPEAQTRLFKPFERVDSHLRIKTPGTGLGLYLTKKITEDFLHGEIHMHSQSGVGSTFTVTLPIVSPQPINTETHYVS
jgi:signal transduction histidine kinase/CHASE1-domain containing sensor protein/GAF domain-containing protein